VVDLLQRLPSIIVSFGEVGIDEPLRDACRLIGAEIRGLAWISQRGRCIGALDLRKSN
jgi:hypothetical protein